MLGALALFVVAGEAGLHRVLLPHRRDQVPASVISEGGQLGALRFGFEMGTGVRTHMPSNLPYLPLAVAVLFAGWAAALLIGLGFGFGRTWMALGRHHGGAADWDAQWRRHSRWLRRTLTVVLLGLMTMLVVT